MEKKMGQYLILDIGAGTIDLLYFDTDSGVHYKTVAKSPVLSLAEQASRLPGDLLVTGVEMGGGALSGVLRKRAQKSKVTMSASSAATIHHNMEKVRSWGIEVIGDEAAEGLRQENRYSVLSIGDLEPERLRHTIEGLGVPYTFDVVGICAQDHGTPPDGVSHLDYRHQIFKARLDDTPYPDTLLFGNNEVPDTFNRLRSLAESAKSLPTDDIYVMDSGMAAILGASMDHQARGKKKIMVLDVATSHTVGAALENGQIAGFFEYHTHDITLDRLEVLLIDLADGKLSHERILEEGGHGAYCRRAIQFEASEIIIATGPKRRLMANSKLPIVLGAPLGDNMMTGTVGVLEAIRRHKDLPEFSYL
jgi:uncharacterized protein (DUF1786 family)